jgi:hypothetical protein
MDENRQLEFRDVGVSATLLLLHPDSRAVNNPLLGARSAFPET